MNKGPRSNVKSLTGEIVPITFKEMQGRVNSIRRRLQPRTTIEHQHNQTMQVRKRSETITADLETDQISTNFNPQKPQIRLRSAAKSFTRSKQVPRQSVQFESDKKRPMTSYKRGFRISKQIEPSEVKTKTQGNAVIFKQQIGEFKKIYENLAAILENEREGGLSAAEEAIGEYLNHFQSRKLSFIDDFLDGRLRRFKKVIRETRLHQSLSVAYLFLQLAQGRAENNESYLTNFLGYCLSNVLLTTRLYILKEGRPEYEQSQFQTAIRGVQISSFGKPLTNVDDILLRIQHNNEILTMMHRKLGRFNPKFEVCIQLFFKTAERKGTSCSQCTYYIFEYLALHIHESELTGLSKTLQIAPVPYCPPPQKPYTLIIEPLGILVNEKRTRPYLFQFFEWASKHFQLILWTWEMPYDPQIEYIYGKLNQYLVARLYRYHCIEEDDIWVKDLSRLGRDLEKVVIVDYDKRIFYRQPRNGVELRWKNKGVVKDKGLLLLCQILQQMVSSDGIVEDMVTIYAEQLFNIRGY